MYMYTYYLINTIHIHLIDHGGNVVFCRTIRTLRIFYHSVSSF